MTTVCFPEPEVPDLTDYGRYAGRPASTTEWLTRSSRADAGRLRDFLNRSLGLLPGPARRSLCRRFREDPAFDRIFFELVVGRFLQELGAEVEHEPIGRGSVTVDWRATFADGGSVLVEATSPAYNEPAHQERLRREALVAVVEAAMPPGWWVIPRDLPEISLHESRRELRRVVESLLADLPDPTGWSIDNRLRLEGTTRRGDVVLELWPGDPEASPIAMASMGGWIDDSVPRIRRAVRTKRDQARAFPGEPVILALDAPWGGPDVERFDMALLGHTAVHLDIELRHVTHSSFHAEGALAKQRAAEYGAVLAFERVGTFGGRDPLLYRHPRYDGELPAGLLVLRQRFLHGDGIVDVPATRVGIIDGLGFPSAG